MTLLVHFIEFRKYSVHSFYYIHYKCVLFTFAALNGLGQIYISEQMLWSIVQGAKIILQTCVMLYYPLSLL